MDRVRSAKNGRRGLIPIFSIYSGIGGLDLGAKIAGFEVAVGLDADQRAAAVHHEVFGSPVVSGRTEELDIQEVVRRSGVSRDGSAVLIGGPPCTAFSHAGFWIEAKRNGKDAQAGRIVDYLEFVKQLRPRAFVMENVPGLLFKNHRMILSRFEAACTRLGYSVTHEILNSADFGIPQRRRRLFVVGVRGRIPFQFVKGDFIGQPRTSGWAIKSLLDRENPLEKDEKLAGKYAALLPRVPPGENYLCFTAERGCTHPLFGWRQKYWSFLLKLHPEEPSPTIPATRITYSGPFHWRDRHLRLAELKRLQSFPDSYPCDHGAAGRQQLGNAVPPVLAAQVMWQLRRFLGDGNRTPGRLRLALDRKSSAHAVSSALTIA